MFSICNAYHNLTLRNTLTCFKTTPLKQQYMHYCQIQSNISISRTCNNNYFLTSLKPFKQSVIKTLLIYLKNNTIKQITVHTLLAICFSVANAKIQQPILHELHKFFLRSQGQFFSLTLTV